MQAKDFMTRRVITISPDHSISHAARMMLENRISGLLVCDDNGKLVGVLSEGDLLRRAELGSAAWRSPANAAEQMERFTKSHSWRVGDVMTQQVITVGEDMAMDSVAATMSANENNRVPVVREERIVGVTATGDQAVRRAVLTRLCSDLGLDRETTDVTIQDGSLCLWGQVDSEAQRKAACVAAESICAVGSVKDRLRIVASCWIVGFASRALKTAAPAALTTGRSASITSFRADSSTPAALN